MSSESPVVEIFSSDGIELPVQNGVATPANTRGILVAGSDGTNSRFISTNTSGAIATTAPILTKGTQSSNGWSVQDLKDSGRVIKTYVATAVAGVTTEGIMTLTPYADMVVGSATTTFAVTSGKRLRLQVMVATWKNTTAAIGSVNIRFRVNATGAAIVSSPVQFALSAMTVAATSGLGNTDILSFPDGLELSGSMQF
jgi:hypothetical protein